VTVEERLQAVVDRAGRDRQLTGIVAAVEHPASGLVWTGVHGECRPDTAFFIASTTKLHTSAIVLRLVERGALRLDDRLVDVLGGSGVNGSAAVLDGLHVIGGVDRTGEITIRHLMAQTSGLGDYFQGKPAGGSSLEAILTGGTDRGWMPTEAIDLARQVGASFPPGHRRKALYADTNYQLLGMVIERVLGVRYPEALQHEILDPLGLTRTRVYLDPADASPLPLRFGDRVLEAPKAMASFGPDGGIVSTAGELMTFVRGFFEGGLFRSETIEELQDYRRIFFPLQYGVGFARFAMPRLLGGEELIGHSGLSGAFAFVAPRRGVYVTGTVNNIDDPGRSFRMMLRLVRAARPPIRETASMHPEHPR
jgi:CubicO group peptidase (beta-lactamase class C family)